MPQLDHGNNLNLDVISIGNAIVDILVVVDDEFLEEHNLVKSTMRLCSAQEQQAILGGISEFSHASGGSAANTVSSIAGLGAKAGFLGSIANDHWGLMFEESFKKTGVVILVETIIDAELSTGTSAILVTPDSERTMNTHLGAAAYISRSTIRPDIIKQTPILFVEGYAFDKESAKDAMTTAVKLSQASGNRVAVTLSDPECVNRHHADFVELINEVDIVFANEAEICRLWEIENQQIDENIIEKYSKLTAPITVITQSERGCTVISEGNSFSLPAISPNKLIDVTGAGDQFAAGFLFGLVRNWDLATSAKFGIELATLVISRIGPRLEKYELESALETFINS